MSPQQFSDADRFGCEGCPSNTENREYLQQRGVSISGVDGKPKSNPVLEAIDYAVQPENNGITTEQHNEMIDDIRAAYLQRHPQGPEVAGRTTKYYTCPQCKTPINMAGTGLEGLNALCDVVEYAPEATSSKDYAKKRLSELKPTPTLPETSGDMSSLVGDGDA